MRKLSKPMTRAEMAAEEARELASRKAAETEAILNEGLRGPLPVGHVWNASVGYIATRPMYLSPSAGGYWSNSGPGSSDRGGTWNN